MAVNVMAAVWETGLPTNAKMILLRLADAADPDGSNAWPSIGSLARYTGLSRTTVKQYLGQFREEGLIEAIGKVKGGRGRTTNYRVYFLRAQQLYPLPPVDDPDELRGVSFASDPPSEADLAQIEAEKAVSEKGPDPAEKGSDEGEKGSEAPATNLPTEPPLEPGARASGAAAAPEGAAAPRGKPEGVTLATYWREVVMPALRDKFGKVEVDVHMQAAVPHKDDRITSTFEIAVPNEFHRHMLDQRYRRHLQAIVGRRFVKFVITKYAVARWVETKNKKRSA